MNRRRFEKAVRQGRGGEGVAGQAFDHVFQALAAVEAVLELGEANLGRCLGRMA